MSNIKIGCCGWPKNRKAYFSTLGAVEINSSFYQPPRPKTAESWRSEAPQGFEFSIKAWQLITHPSSSPTYEKLGEKLSDKGLARCGHFRPSVEVELGWERTLALAETLRARFIVFQTPSTFYPNADHLRDMYRFFKGLKKTEASLVWEPRGVSWREETIRRVCADLGLVHAVDPFNGKAQRGSVHYYRLHGGYEGGRIIHTTRYQDAQLRHVLERCEGKPSYVFFNNMSMWDDALRLKSLMTGLPIYGPSHVRHLRSY